MTRTTLLRVASNQCTAGRPIPRRTYALPVMIRVIPENEIPRALHVDIYLCSLAQDECHIYSNFFIGTQTNLLCDPSKGWRNPRGSISAFEVNCYRSGMVRSEVMACPGIGRDSVNYGKAHIRHRYNSRLYKTL